MFELHFDFRLVFDFSGLRDGWEWSENDERTPFFFK